MKKINPELDTTRFVNIDDKPFDIYNNKNLAFHLDAKEEKTILVFIAQIGAKHLVDRILQEKHGIKDTLRDSPLRKSLFAQILPDLAQELDIKPLTPDQEKDEIKKQLQKQDEAIAELRGEVNKGSEKDKEIAELKERLAKIEASSQPQEKKAGRPKKE